MAAWLVAINWDTFGLGEQFWAVAVIVVGIVIALSVLFTRRDPYYALVVDWALLGILLQRLSVNDATDQGIVITTIAGVAIISAGVVVQAIRKKVY